MPHSFTSAEKVAFRDWSRPFAMMIPGAASVPKSAAIVCLLNWSWSPPPSSNCLFVRLYSKKSGLPSTVETVSVSNRVNDPVTLNSNWLSWPSTIEATMFAPTLFRAALPLASVLLVTVTPPPMVNVADGRSYPTAMVPATVTLSNSNDLVTLAPVRLIPVRSEMR
jgi:hypothetical protein